MNFSYIDPYPVYYLVNHGGECTYIHLDNGISLVPWQHYATQDRPHIFIKESSMSGADTGFGRGGGGQEIFRWDNGVSSEATEGGLGERF